MFFFYHIHVKYYNITVNKHFTQYEVHDEALAFNHLSRPFSLMNGSLTRWTDIFFFNIGRLPL